MCWPTPPAPCACSRLANHRPSTSRWATCVKSSWPRATHAQRGANLRAHLVCEPAGWSSFATTWWRSGDITHCAGGTVAHRACSLLCLPDGGHLEDGCWLHGRSGRVDERPIARVALLARAGFRRARWMQRCHVRVNADAASAKRQRPRTRALRLAPMRASGEFCEMPIKVGPQGLGDVCVNPRRAGGAEDRVRGMRWQDRDQSLSAPMGQREPSAPWTALVSLRVCSASRSTS